MRRWQRDSRIASKSQRQPRARGQALVEFSFVFPIIMLLAFGFIDVGRAVFEWNTLTNAARSAARVLVVNQIDPAGAPWNCQANKPVESVSSPNWTARGCAIAAGGAIGVGSSDITISYAAPPGVNLECTSRRNIGCLATVTVVNTFQPITPIAGSIIGPMSMSATSEMPIERLFPEQP
jgi:Flp pilus assembly protein TadG